MILLAELADKTQLVTFALVAETGKPTQVYLGVLGGLFTVTIIGVLAGSLITLLIPILIIQLVAGTAFIILGLITIFKARHAQKSEETISSIGKRVWARAFLLLFLAELGDKTQLIVILESAITGQLLIVFATAFLALALVNGIGVIIGDCAR